MDMARKIWSGKKRFAIGGIVALFALLIAATAAFAAPPVNQMGPVGQMMAQHGPNGNKGGAGDNNGGPGMFGHGIRAVVTGSDAGASTISLAGLPDTLSPIKIDSTVKLEKRQADGTNATAAIGDFTNGSLVEVRLGRSKNAPAATTTTPNQRGGNVAVTGLVLLPANVVETGGLVVSTGNGSFAIATEGGVRLTIKTDGNTKYTKGKNTAGTATDIKVGSRVMVSGTQSGDTITATTVHYGDASMIGQGGMMPNGQRPNGNPPAGNPPATATAKP